MMCNAGRSGESAAPGNPARPARGVRGSLSFEESEPQSKWNVSAEALVASHRETCLRSSVTVLCAARASIDRVASCLIKLTVYKQSAYGACSSYNARCKKLPPAVTSQACVGLWLSGESCVHGLFAVRNVASLLFVFSQLACTFQTNISSEKQRFNVKAQFNKTTG